MSSSPAAPDRRRALFRGLAVVLGLLVGFAVLEGVVRVGLSTDDDGNMKFRGGRVRPYALPVAWSERQVKALRGSTSACFTYDRDLGWRPNPQIRCHRGMYIYDRSGIRSYSVRHRIPREVPPGSIRVAMFGDSFTHGDDVPMPDTWGHALKWALAERGQPSQILNFGVSGYGLDQALLRYRKNGVRYQPDIVVLGFQAENILRNLNMIRVLYFWRTHLPFTKPRFVLEDGALVLKNVPAVAPDDLPGVLENLEQWPLLPFEGFYEAGWYEDHWWLSSRLLGYFAGWEDHRVGLLDDPGQAAYYEPGSEACALAVAIVEQLRREVENRGGRLVVVHLPKRVDLRRVLSGEPMWHDALRDDLAARVEWVETEAALLEAAREGGVEGLFTGSGHYAEAGSAVVGRAVAEAIVGE